MIKKLNLILALIYSLMLCTCTSNEPSTSPELNLDSLKQLSNQSLYLSVSSNKTTYQSGEKVKLTYTLCNFSPDTIIVLTEWYMHYPITALTIINPYGISIERIKSWEIAYPFLESFTALNPGNCFSEAGFINGNNPIYDLNTVGQYTLIGRYVNYYSEYYNYQREAAGPSNAWIGVIEADTVRFTVVP